MNTRPEIAVKKAGYPGKDKMREKAESMLKHEIKKSGILKPSPKSQSCADNAKLPVFKKGGNVRMREKVKGLDKSFEGKKPKESVNTDLLKRFGMNEGGSVEEKSMGGSCIKPKKMAMGGIGKLRHQEMTESGKPVKCKTLRKEPEKLLKRNSRTRGKV